MRPARRCRGHCLAPPPPLAQPADHQANSYLPAIGRFLIVVTFLEDALRIITQWNDQLLYLHDYRKCNYPPTRPCLAPPGASR